MTAAAPPTPWRMCQACGHWQRAPEVAACDVCQWPRLAPGAPGTDLAEFRVTLPRFHRHLRFRDNFPIGGLYELQAQAQG